MLAKRLLEEKGHIVDTADNGYKAIKNLSLNHYDIVIMDCQMPEIDGYETTKIIRSGAQKILNSKIPIIAFTANAMEGDREKALQAGMDDYLAKPIDAKELFRVIDHWLKS